MIDDQFYFSPLFKKNKPNKKWLEDLALFET